MSESGPAVGTLDPVGSVEDRARRAKVRTSKGYAKTAKVGALWSIGRESVTQLIAFPTGVILARLLTPADFGIAAAAAFFIQLGKRLGNMGLNTSLVRMKEVREEHRASVFFLNLVIGLASWGTLMLAAPYIAAYYDEPRVTGALRLASTIFLVNFFGVVEYAILQREMKFKEMAWIEWIVPTLFLPVSLGMALAGWGYWSLILGQVVASSAGTCAKVYFGGWRPSLAVTRRGLADTVPFGLGIYAKRLLSYASDNLDSLLVGGLFGVSWLGHYDKAFNTADNMSNRLALGGTTMFRIFAIIQDERERLVRAYTKVVLAGTILTLPVFAGLIVAAREFILVVFGGQWLPAVFPLQLLAAAGAVRVLGGTSSSVVTATGQIWSEVWRRVVYVLLIGVLIYALRGWGIAGAAAAVLVATVVAFLLVQALLGRILSLSWWEMAQPLLPGLLSAAGTASAVAVTTAGARMAWPPIPDWLLLGLQIAAGGLFFGAFTLFARFPAMQDVVDEVLDDIVPAPVRRVVDRIRRRRPRQLP